MGRLAAHVLLDAVATFDSSRPDDDAGEVLDLAVARLGEMGCVTATFDDATDTATVDASPLVGGTAVLINALVQRIVSLTGRSREEVMHQKREIIDQSISRGDGRLVSNSPPTI
ncbi:hypothetical protein [Micromonospora sp. WMMC250]|uniref:hypothetical protein n=1 Tax=Micromonospora sp. WMMC250 TaxID=3014781 RepID=UPI0022B6F907|nr:hypothetical protein [Micromonospora sp. WMMC250]MCZ7373283.1 hypothetical protein [Micromonospora sp. WMMC250]MCZ7373322.1 hypothetical protein [Micromonospora sp. WMMC250]MCZ7379933.1 hypothetical protein [Micromonospora sp. WMMC250]